MYTLEKKKQKQNNNPPLCILCTLLPQPFCTPPSAHTLHVEVEMSFHIPSIPLGGYIVLNMYEYT